MQETYKPMYETKAIGQWLADYPLEALQSWETALAAVDELYQDEIALAQVTTTSAANVSDNARRALEAVGKRQRDRHVALDACLDYERQRDAEEGNGEILPDPDSPVSLASCEAERFDR